MSRSFIAVLLLVLSLGACRPLYLPPVPERVEVEQRLALSGSMTAREGQPRLELQVDQGPAEEGWLAIQWFAPNNREVASESVWLEAGVGGDGRIVVELPADVLPASPGRWRALLSFDGVVVRQFSAEVE